MSPNPPTDPRPLASRAAPRTTRRQFLGRGAAVLGGLALGPSLLSACGGDGGDGNAATTAGGTTTDGGLQGTKLVILNWPLYIENDDAETSATLRAFSEQTGIEVDYRPEIDGNDSFYTKYEPQLSAGRGIGADLVVLTSWMAARMIEQGFVQELDATSVPNRSNILPDLADPDFDPGRRFSLPYAIGQAGLAYYPDKVGGEIDDVNVIFDRRFAGKVTILDEMRDSVGLTMLGMGLDPSTGSVADAEAAIAKIAKAREAGQFKRITGNSYTEDLDLGDTWIAMAWSGDIASLRAENEDLAWVIPKQGGMRFVDNMLIPIGAANKAGAEAFMNFLYQPSVAAGLYEAINYVPPVAGAKEEMTAEAQSSPFINPPPTPKLYDFRTLTPEEDERLGRAFAEATQQ
jgi:spermidine/putrescine transport system substrate-binding protein